ncbi:MAG: beta-lactamase family protein [Deltaproteobacteria bacterium]|nr:beta-lactamase family protein [Deltaproteobacteria bacterium]MBW2537656.1 beta-lactamase family protein [Deltaproteobacteria bacterium]
MAKAGALIDAERQSSELPGLELGIETPRCGARYALSGYAVIEPAELLTPEHAMSVGSTSKSFAAAALMRLAEQGTLSVDDPLSTWDPDWPQADEITVRHLLGHRSGIPDYFGAAGCYPDRMTQDNTPEDLLSCVRGEPLLFQPGEHYAYSNTNYVLVGKVIEAVSGQNAHEAIRSLVLGPAGLESTGYDTDSPPPWARAAHVYFGDDDVTGEWSSSYAWTAGDLVSNAPDLLRWLRVVLYGDLLSGESRSAMQTFLDGEGDTSGDYGLGLLERQVKDAEGRLVATLRGHGGRWVASDEPYFAVEWDAALVLMLNERVNTTGSHVPPAAYIGLPNEMMDRLVVELAPWFEAL